jgi:hypothetical protein
MARRKASNDVLRPERGGFLRPFHTGIFIRDYLLGKGPFGAKVIDPDRGAPIDDIRAAYKKALLEAYAGDYAARALEKGIELSLEQALKRIPQRLTKMRSHSFYRYFQHLKMLQWVEPTGEEGISYMGGNPGALVAKTDEFLEMPGRKTTLLEVPQPKRFYRLTDKGKAASDLEWQDPLQTLYGYPLWQRHGKLPPSKE